MAKKDIVSRFGEKLRRLRERKKWGQVELAVEAGVARQVISKIENGRMEPCLRTQQKLARAFRMTVSQLMRGL